MVTVPMFRATDSYQWGGGVVPAPYKISLKGANHFIFTPQQDNVKINSFWRFGENPAWWRHIMARDVIFRRRFPMKITSRDIKWRHHIGFLPNVQEIFLIMISCCGENIKSFAPFKRKLLTVLYIFPYYMHMLL